MDRNNIFNKFISSGPGGRHLMTVFHVSVLLLIMNFVIVKVAVDPQSDNRVDPQTTLTML